jgi:hypothetical protein
MSDAIELGTVVSTGSPLLVSRQKLGNVHFRGMTGSGKSSMGAIPLIAQLMSPYRLDGGPEERDPLFIFDLGGDQSLFHTSRTLAERAERRFRHVTLDPDLHSDHFPPFQAIPPGERNVLGMASFLVTAMHLDYGIVYGGSYFTSQNVSSLLEVARRISREDGASATLDDVSAFLDSPRNRKLFKDADQVRMLFNFLKEYPQLSESGHPEDDILFERALNESEVIYFFLPTLTEPQSARIVAGLALYTAVQAAMRRTKLGKPKRRAKIFIDEFQTIVGPSLGALLAQARKFGISFVLLNQSTSQLENRDVDLADVVFEGTSTKIYFTVQGKKDVDDLQLLSGETIKSLGGTSTQKFTQSKSTHEVILPKLELDKILEVSATFGQAFACLNHGNGRHEPIIIQTRHQFRDLSDVPMPARKTPQEKPAAKTPRKEHRDADLMRRKLSELLAAKRRAEAWDGPESGGTESSEQTE